MNARAIRRRAGAATGQWPDAVLPLLRRIYAARGAVDIDAARPRLAALPAPDTLLDIDAATALLAEAVARGHRILVVGDFDCDGATATAVAVRGLRLLGAGDVRCAVPNRIAHGYGLSPGLVDVLAAHAPQLLLTVDHGIACHAGIAAARARGWRVVVTDHHLPGATLPQADAIVNPNREGDPFPAKKLAGVGVVFYLLLALRRRLRAAGAFAGRDLPDLGTLLDLVAVGTVADLVPLDAANRALVGAGLRRLRSGRGCAGLVALAEAAGRPLPSLSAADIAFGLAPRLNAAGRLEDMALGIECLLADDPAHARGLARTLDGINAERRQVQQAMVEEADVALARRPAAVDGTPPAAVCVFDDGWHPGVVGLVASKLKERLHRPVVAFAPAAPGSGDLRGSARSIPGFHVRDALAAVDCAHPGLIARFGGHAMAAGLQLPRAALPAFEAAFTVHAGDLLDDGLLQAVVDSDGELAAHEFDHRHACALRDGGPWGQGFAEPLFDGEFEVVGSRVVGSRHLKLLLRHPQRAAPLDAIHFGGAGTGAGLAAGRRVRLAYRLAPDDYRGGEAIQLLVEYLEPG